jgi:CRP-like cAMP-binding protein
MAIEEDIAFFESVPTLRVLGRAALRVLAIGAETRYVHGGEALFNKGDAGDCGYLVQEGSFQLSTHSAHEAREGNDIAGPGTLLGEFALIAKTVHSLTATAIEPSTVIRISRALFIKMLEGHPDAARRLRDQLAARVDESVKDMQRVRDVIEGRRGHR